MTCGTSKTCNGNGRGLGIPFKLPLHGDESKHGGKEVIECGKSGTKVRINYLVLKNNILNNNNNKKFPEINK